MSSRSRRPDRGSKPPMPVECRLDYLCRRRSVIARTRMVRVSGVPIRWRACTTRPKPSSPPSRKWRSTPAVLRRIARDALAREPGEYTAFSARFAVAGRSTSPPCPIRAAEIWGHPTSTSVPDPCRCGAGRRRGGDPLRIGAIRQGHQSGAPDLKTFARTASSTGRPGASIPDAGMRAIREFPPLRLALPRRPSTIRVSPGWCGSAEPPLSGAARGNSTEFIVASGRR